MKSALPLRQGTAQRRSEATCQDVAEVAPFGLWRGRIPKMSLALLALLALVGVGVAARGAADGPRIVITPVFTCGSSGSFRGKQKQ